MQLTIKEFDPLKAEVATLVDNVKKTVASSTGAEGYELLKENKKALQSKRIDFVKILKDKRSGAREYASGIVAVENELLSIIEKVESTITSEIKKVDDEKKREKRRELLPERQQKLKDIEVSLTDDEILDMDDKKFAEFYIDQKGVWLEEKEAKIKADEKKKRDEEHKLYNERKNLLLPYWNYLKKDHRECDYGELPEESFNILLKEVKKTAKKQKEVELENIKKQAKIDAEEVEKRKADAEKKRLDSIAKQKADNEKKAKKKLAYSKKYQAFLKENGVTKDNKGDFYVEDAGVWVILYKKVSVFTK